MYDDVDFMNRPVIGKNNTWSLELFRDLKESIPSAAEYFECGKPVFNLNSIPQLRNQRIAENFKEGIVTDSFLERWSMPTRFGKRYAAEMNARKNLTLLEGFEARDFSAPDIAGKVSSLIIRESKTGMIRRIRAGYFVVAAGAQESTRILLRNQQLFRNLSAPPEALGKYYQGHISGKIASVHFTGDPGKTDFGFHQDEDGTYIRRRFQFDNSFLAKNNLLNTAMWLDNPLYFDPKHRNGAMSFMYLAMITPFLGKRLAPPAIAHSVTKGKVTGMFNHIWNIIRGLPGSILIPVSIFYKRYCVKRKLPGVFLFSPENKYALHFHAEQIPDAENKMELGPDGESLVIHYKLTDADIHSVIRLHEELDRWLRSCNCGRLEYWHDKADLPEAIRKMSKDGLHQSGTTRIANNPESGVVDGDLKLWGTNNVFVCSSSVFPTSGQANPTFLLGAFAVRLANLLTKKSITHKNTRQAVQSA
jgi:choline dehydrogenase-like flavoprotein